MYVSVAVVLSALPKRDDRAAYRPEMTGISGEMESATTTPNRSALSISTQTNRYCSSSTQFPSSVFIFRRFLKRENQRVIKENATKRNISFLWGNLTDREEEEEGKGKKE